METMTFNLLREENDNCYLYGSIYLNGEFICDTLEFGSNVVLPDSKYRLMLGRDMTKNETIIVIYDFMGNMVSKLVRNNTMLYREIKMRRQTNDICIGIKINNPLLINDSYVSKLLITHISGEINRGNEVELIIETPLKVQKTLVPLV